MMTKEEARDFASKWLAIIFKLKQKINQRTD